MSLEDGLNLSKWRGVLFDRANPNSVSLLFRVLWAVDQFDAEGIAWRADEAGRPRGQEVPDFAAGRIPPDGDESKTASGLSTMWFQSGRASKGYTPSAADPETQTSEHTKGLAIDIWTNNRRRQEEIFQMVGMFLTVDGEPWHEAIRQNPAAWITFDKYVDEVNGVFDITSLPKPKPLTTLITRRRR